jgi:hypothetical protein
MPYDASEFANENKSLYNLNELAQVSLGQNGFVFVSTTDAQTGSFGAIQVIASGATTFSALAAANSTVGGLTSEALMVGTVIYGPFTGFTLASGSKVIAYKA